MKNRTTTVGDLVELDLKSVIGFSTPGTMKVRGLMGEREVVVLIDCGATHNFIAQKLVDDLELPVTVTSSYGIVMGNGVAMRGKGVCKAVVFTLQDLTVKEIFLPLELAGADLILGMIWLRSMRYTEVDWVDLTMTFNLGDRMVTLRGDPSLTKMEVSLKVLTKTWSDSDQGFLVEFRDLNINEQKDEEDSESEDDEDLLSSRVKRLLSENECVFQLLEGLPPKRVVDHCIVLKEGQPPVNVRPYQ